jgi:hypothetical protein
MCHKNKNKSILQVVLCEMMDHTVPDLFPLSLVMTKPNTVLLKFESRIHEHGECGSSVGDLVAKWGIWWLI